MELTSVSLSSILEFNEEAKKIAEANNILYIDNKCTKIEFEKHFN